MAELLRLRGYGRATDPLGGGVVPQVDQEEQASVLADLGERALGGLSYVGKMADKAFGGRAVRGVLGGNLREALSVIPGSDTLGLTDEADTVTGRQLAEQAGWVGRGDPNSFDAGDALGLAMEVGLDPGTYLTFGAGAATRLGKLAAKTAPAFRGGTAERIGGYAARASDVEAFARMANISEGAARQRLGLSLSDNLLPRELDAAAQAAGIAAEPRLIPSAAGGSLVENPAGATALSGAVGIGLPFGVGGGPQLVLGTGRIGQTVSRFLPGALATRAGQGVSDAIEGATGFSPARSLRAAFDTSVKGATSAAVQDAAANFTTPLEKQLQRAGLADTAAVSQQMGKFRASPELADLAGRRATIIQEGVEGTRYGRQAMADIERQMLALGATPADLSGLDAVATGVAGVEQRGLAAQQARGVNAPPLDDIVDYSLRQRTELPRQDGESLWSYAVRSGQANAARTASTGQRDNIFRYVPGGQDQVNSWVKDPSLVAAARQGDPAVQQRILADLMEGAGRVAATPRFQKKADDLLGTAAGQKMQKREIDRLLAAGPQLPSTMAAVPDTVRGQIADRLAQRTLDRNSRRMAEYLGTLPDDRVRAGLYSNDIVGRYQTYLNRQAQVLSTADTATEVMGRTAVPHLSDGNTMSIDSLLGAMNLTGQSRNGLSTVKQELADRLYVPVSQIDQMGVPAEVAADLLKMNTRWQNPGELRPALAAWDFLTQAFKTGVTTPFPAFHVRNLTDALTGKLRGQALGSEAEAYTLARGGELSPATAERLFGPGVTTREATDRLAQELIANPATYSRGSLTRDTLGDLGQTVLSNPTPFAEPTGRSLAGDAAAGLGRIGYAEPLARYAERRAAGAGPVRSGLSAAVELAKAPVKAGAAVGDLTENVNRISHYLQLRRQGFASDNAADQVAKLQRDYGDLTNFEKQVMRRLMPFYSFSRRNTAALADEISTDPARLAAMTRLTTGAREPGSFVPPYIAEGTSIPLGQNDDGSQRYISSLGLPFEDEAVKSLGNLARGDLPRALQGLLGQAQPYLKAPIEQAFGRQLYSGRRLDELRPSATLAAVIGNDPLARQATQIVANTPLARALSTVDRLQDDRKGAGATLANLLTGGRVTDVDREAQEPVANRRLLEEVLRGQPGIRSADTLFLSRLAVDQGQVPPETLALYRTYLDQQKKIQENTDKRRREAGL